MSKSTVGVKKRGLLHENPLIPTPFFDDLSANFSRKRSLSNPRVHLIHPVLCNVFDASPRWVMSVATNILAGKIGWSGGLMLGAARHPSHDVACSLALS